MPRHTPQRNANIRSVLQTALDSTPNTGVELGTRVGNVHRVGQVRQRCEGYHIDVFSGVCSPYHRTWLSHDPQRHRSRLGARRRKIQRPTRIVSTPKELQHCQKG
eukprot:PhF_6_TR40369/c0_g1_i1/m.60088